MMKPVPLTAFRIAAIGRPTSNEPSGEMFLLSSWPTAPAWRASIGRMLAAASRNFGFLKFPAWPR